MCGAKSERKGYDIFINLVKTMPYHDFVWIGDSFDNNNIYSNYYQIEHCKNPYNYIQKLDYLLVTSRIDPCPYVILESLYLNVPCIVFDGNITYEHTLKNNYHIIYKYLLKI